MSIPCPCGGRAYSRDEMIRLDIALANDGQYPATAEYETRIRESWRQVLSADAYYCPDEDDVLLPSEVERMRGES
jgi:hypothetical protein